MSILQRFLYSSLSPRGVRLVNQARTKTEKCALVAVPAWHMRLLRPLCLFENFRKEDPRDTKHERLRLLETRGFALCLMLRGYNSQPLCRPSFHIQ